MSGAIASLSLAGQAGTVPVPVDLTTYASELDGATVIEIDTFVTTGRLRVYVNDGVVFDGHPEHEEDPVQRLSRWLTTNLGLPDRPTRAQTDEAIRLLGNSSVPEVLDTLKLLLTTT